MASCATFRTPLEVFFDYIRTENIMKAVMNLIMEKIFILHCLVKINAYAAILFNIYHLPTWRLLPLIFVLSHTSILQSTITLLYAPLNNNQNPRYYQNHCSAGSCTKLFMHCGAGHTWHMLETQPLIPCAHRCRRRMPNHSDPQCLSL